jgi:hypothetical protein
MRILRSVRHKHCADGTFMKEFLLDQPVSNGFLRFLEQFATVELLPGIGEGFYRVEKAGCFSVKGLVGDTAMEVRFRPEAMDLTVDFLYSLLYWYRDGNPDLLKLHQLDAALADRLAKRFSPERCT